ncbi:neutral protease 2 [Trichoderma guizhouense]|uniref:Neutral protease 2 n=1 Tax=Trichoderma guizhouense TaxID=1491466 RepID=A0A0H4LUM0_9HYPO|nr:neutral metallopeptidase NMP1 [Trichoderma guizhouense]OPB36603.1 neutral protease 2 [Trichoderma guizhouense]
MKFISGLIALAALASAAPGKAPTPLDIKLEGAGNAEIKAVITNTGKNNLKIFKTGTILDSAPVEKVTISSGEHIVTFDGVRQRISTQNLAEDAFQHIAAGESIEVTFDIAEAHDLSIGGKYDIQSVGAFSFAQEESNELVGSVPFETNKIEIEVDGEDASARRVAFHQKRTRVQSDCTGSKLSVTQTALRNCASVASLAQQAAASGAAAKLTEYFKSSTSSVRSTVSGVFSRVLSECSSTSSGVASYYCSDVLSSCSSNVLAYTLPSSSLMVYCNLYFTALPALTRSCHAQDQATTNIHEITHLSQVKGTQDYNGYGYNFVRSLTAAQNLNHADTYALFANAIYAGC